MKRIIKTYIFPVLAGSALAMASCSHFDDMNIDPNKVEKIAPGSLLAPLLYDMGAFGATRSFDFTWQLMQVGIPYPATATGVHRYDITPTAGNSTWNKGYTWLRSIDEMELVATDSTTYTFQAVTSTLKAYAAGMLTDAFGDIPFSEAIKYDEGNTTPVFDEQKDIYASLISSLEKANDIYAEAIEKKLPMDGNDILFKNDKEKWQKFNNALLMRLLLRTSKRTEMNAYDRLKEIIDNPAKYPIFSSNNEAAILKINGLSPYSYAWARYQDYTLNEVKAAFFVDMLNAYDDPRRPFFMTKAASVPAGTDIGYKGIPAAHEMGATFDFKASIPNYNLMVPQSPGIEIHEILLSYAEVEFIKSEVYLHFGETDKAEDSYKKGTIAGITQWVGIPNPGDTYFTNPEVAFNGTLERIMNQKYLALYMCDYQQWFEYRRTGFPVLPKTEYMLNDGVMPTRFMYHDKLSITNPANYQIAVGRLDKGDSPLSTVWWEK